MVSRLLGVGQQPSSPKKKQRERERVVRLNSGKREFSSGRRRSASRARACNFFARINETINAKGVQGRREGSLTGLRLFLSRWEAIEEKEEGGSSGEDRPISINRDRRRRRGCRESNLRDRWRKVTSQLAPCHPVRPFHPLWLTSICHRPTTRARHLPYSCLDIIPTYVFFLPPR